MATTHGTVARRITGATQRQREWRVSMTNGLVYRAMGCTPESAVGAVLELLGDRFPGVTYERVLDEYGVGVAVVRCPRCGGEDWAVGTHLWRCKACGRLVVP